METKQTPITDALEATGPAFSSDAADAALHLCRKLEADRAALIAALADVLLHVGGHRETDFVQPLPLTWSATVREAKRVLRSVQS